MRHDAFDPAVYIVLLFALLLILSGFIFDVTGARHLGEGMACITAAFLIFRKVLLGFYRRPHR